MRPKAWLKSGAYLIIEKTEAMVVVDVNSGTLESERADTIKLHPSFGTVTINNPVIEYVAGTASSPATPTVTHGTLSCRENSGGFSNVSVSSNYALDSTKINYVVTQSGAATSDSFIVYVNLAEYAAEL